jgi:uncharacterized protein (TIGR03067 family)
MKAARLIAAGQAAAVGASLAALTQGVLKAMAMTKIKAVVGVIAVTFALVCGGGLIAFQTTAGANGLPEQAAAAGSNLNTGQSKLPAAAAKMKTDEELLQGDWIMVDGENKGEKLELAGVPKTFLKMSFAGDRIIFHDIMLEQPTDITFKVDTTKNPRQLTKFFKSGDKSKSETAIYAVSGDELKICVAGAELPAPTDFTAKKGSGQLLLVYRRDRPDAARDKEQLQGMWQIVAGEMDEMPLMTNVPEGDERRLVVFEGDKVSGQIFHPKGRYLAMSILGMWTIGPPENAGPKLEESKFTFAVDPSKKPRAINFLQGEKWNEAAIYHLEDDQLKIGFSLPGPRMGDRPAGFVGQGTGFIILKRKSSAPASLPEAAPRPIERPPAKHTEKNVAPKGAAEESGELRQTAAAQEPARKTTIIQLHKIAAEDAVNVLHATRRDLVVVAEPVENKIILSCGPQQFDELKRIIDAIDVSPEPARMTTVIQLFNIAAADAVNVLQATGRDMVVVAEPVENKLILNCLPQQLDEIKRIIIAIDVAPTQIPAKNGPLQGAWRVIYSESQGSEQELGNEIRRATSQGASEDRLLLFRLPIRPRRIVFHPDDDTAGDPPAG